MMKFRTMLKNEDFESLFRDPLIGDFLWNDMKRNEWMNEWVKKHTTLQYIPMHEWNSEEMGGQPDGRYGERRKMEGQWRVN